MTHEEIPHEEGAVKLVFAEQLVFAENTVVTVQLAPSAVKSINEQAIGDVKGALKVCVPPQEFVTVNVPELGGLVKETDPESEY